jgi:hypothetical protein
VHAKIRLSGHFSMCLMAVLLNGCQGVGFRTQGQSSQMAASPPQVGDRLESFSFSALSRRSLAWDAERATLTAGTEPRQPTAMFLHVFQPDCHKCQALAETLERLTREEQAGKLAAVGITHRGDQRATINFVRDTGASFPIAVGTGSRWAHTWGRGDPLYVMNREGRVVYMQVGYQEGDLDVWRGLVTDLAEGRTVSVTRPARAGLRTGDALPTVKMTELFSGHGISLASDKGGIVFTDAEGREHRYRATIGFFSRY